MDFVNKALGGGSSSNENQQPTEQKSEGGSGGFLGGLGDKLNNAGGGGAQGEKNEDALDKGEPPTFYPPNHTIDLADTIQGVDFVQEKFLGQGAQNDESAVEQAKDEQISDFIRGQYKSATGSDVPVKDKPTALDKNTD